MLTDNEYMAELASIHADTNRKLDTLDRILEEWERFEITDDEALERIKNL